MANYGNTSYYITLSTAITGSGNTTSASGDIIYLYAENWENSRENKDKIKQMAANNSYNNRMGKMAREQSLNKCVITDEDATAVSNTDSYNLIITRLDEWCDIGGSAVYLIVTSGIDSINVALSRDGSTPLYYIKGTLTRMSSKPSGNVYMVDLTVKETSLY